MDDHRLSVTENKGGNDTLNSLQHAQLSHMNQPSQSTISLVSHDEPSWQGILSSAIRDIDALFQYLELPIDTVATGDACIRDFPIRVPRPYLERIEKGNPNDPLLRQVLPLAEEEQLPPAGFVHDPLGEQAANKVPGIVHKYQGRVLLITNGSCAVHCRYCFRRHFPYEENRLSTQEWEQALDYIRQRKEINEVILSGGDPLSNNDQRLFKLIDAIEGIPHVTRLRIHTRLPIVIPQRITPSLAQRLADSRLAIVTVIHANHANEIDDKVQHSLLLLKQAGVHLLNQTVLLKGVNDSAQGLIDLSERLFEAHTLPYYLHLLDPVVGAHHFDVSESLALALMDDIRNRLPGFLVPKLVREVAGEGSKTPIFPRLSP